MSIYQRVPSDVTIGDSTNICDFQAHHKKNHKFQHHSSNQSNNHKIQKQNEHDSEYLQSRNGSSFKIKNQNYPHQNNISKNHEQLNGTSLKKNHLNDNFSQSKHHQQQNENSFNKSKDHQHVNESSFKNNYQHENDNFPLSKNHQHRSENSFNKLKQFDGHQSQTSNQPSGEDSRPSLSVYHNHNYIGQIVLDHIDESIIHSLDHMIPLDFYIKRYFKVVDYYRRLKEFKYPKADSSRLNVPSSSLSDIPSSSLSISQGSDEQSDEQMLEQSVSISMEDFQNQNSKIKQKEEMKPKFTGTKLQVVQFNTQSQMKSPMKTSKLSNKLQNSRIKSLNKIKNSTLSSANGVNTPSAHTRSKVSEVSSSNRTNSSTCYSFEDPNLLELVWLRRCIKAYLPNIRQLYDYYSQFVDNDFSSEPQFQVRKTPYLPIMNRLAFWQLLRDFKLQKAFNSLVALEIEMWHNPYLKPSTDILRHLKTKMPGFFSHHKKSADHDASRIPTNELTHGVHIDPWDAFQTIPFYTFVHYFLEMSWILFSGKKSAQRTPWPTHLSGCFCKLMTGPLRKQTEGGKVLRNLGYRHLIPDVFAHFSKQANPMSLRFLLGLLKNNKLPIRGEVISTSGLWRIIHEQDQNQTDEKNKHLFCQQDRQNAFASKKSSRIYENNRKTSHSHKVSSTSRYEKHNSHSERNSCSSRRKTVKASQGSLSTIDSCDSNLSTVITTKLTSVSSVHKKRGSFNTSRQSSTSRQMGDGDTSNLDTSTHGQSTKSKRDTRNRSSDVSDTNKCYLKVTKPKRTSSKKLRQVKSRLLQEIGTIGSQEESVATSPNKTFLLDVEKNFLKLDMPDILWAVGRICPRFASEGVVINIDLHLNFLEYYELLVLLCELNAEKSRRLIKFATYKNFHNQFVEPLVEKEREYGREKRKQKSALRMQQKKLKL